ncbi:guanylate cyclase soluble subunit beta-2-like [Astyanax mexicanus]|uniref:guanylate cyclase soluble subunit beta-2-like n=1 Tax=Astyanax mexicanus TaxID=7994 RepID=UPI000BBDEADC|nr:guanylate cyclase soluble subunit beta-2-like [Astyanax mexicanus]XP_049334631.1 guanylate cyclase soluble subunit beta-2-like [Astyanax mexicanus]
MYGFINTCLKSLVIDKFGEDTWNKLRDAACVQDTFMTYEVYKDEITVRLVTEACRLLDVEASVVLKLFGEYFFEFCKRSGYDHMMRTLGANLFEFIENLDALHGYLSISYKEMNAPSFRVEKNSDGTMLLHYYSDRRGLCHIVPGIIGAVAKDFFNSRIEMKIVNQMEEVERTGKKEHVVFLITQHFPDKICSKSTSSPSQQTQKPSGCRHNKVHINKQEVERSRQIKKQICGTQRNHWEMVRSLVQLGKGKLLRGFEPVYPNELCIDLKTFCNAFPFHIVFDEELRVRQAGVAVQKIVPGLQTMGIQLDQYFTILHPEVTFTIASIRKFINSHFVLQTRREMMPESWKDTPMLELRGQMLWMASLRCMLYQASPLLRSLQELEERRMYLSDIAPHDATRHLILLNQQRLAEMELSSQLERKKEELRQLSQHLEQEKQKTENLLYAMLPKHVANQLKEGKKVEAGEFKECTILFSDVVTFTTICSQCEPIQIVIMLNSMYLKFDRLTTVHNVYKVETIGDAYMVVGGVPIPVSSHGERVANFALGMIIASKEVTNPITGGPIQIRVGLHSGPVLAGVVGEKMPRYCLFGDTVNTASRMESHGLPDKIHVSPNVYYALRDKGFQLEERGEIDVKGKGRMRTYFLVKNLRATESEIMGRWTREAGSGQASVQSNCDCSSELPAFRPSLQVIQSSDRRPTVAMRYGDSLNEEEPPATFTEALPSAKSPTELLSQKGKSRDSESYGSLHSGNRSEDEPFHLNEAVRRGPDGAEPPPAAAAAHRKQHVCSRFCVVV